jgi:hypothetical protein
MSRTEQARQLDALASQAATLAEAQALHARADALRGRPAESRWLRTPLFRN